MTISLALLIGMVILLACGVYLLLERSFTRMILGILLIGNATNILVFLTSGRFADAPIVPSGEEPNGDYSDPLPQAFILTAIVITFATLAFMLALLYRSWKLAREDTVSDDEESVALRTADPEADDETFEEGHGPDTEFGTRAEAAVSAALSVEDIDEGHADSDADGIADVRAGQHNGEVLASEQEQDRTATQRDEQGEQQ